MLAIFLIPAALTYTFGCLVGDTRQGWALFAAMTLLFLGFLAVAEYAEQAGNPAFAALGVDQTASSLQPGGNMEGKETRFGIVNSALFATVTTGASCGAVNSMHDSFTPLGGLVPMALIQLGEVVFGGVGSGLYGMLVYAVIGVFVAGLMIGRTPEYLGKKIESFDVKMASLVILIPPLLILGGTALAVMLGSAGAACSIPAPTASARPCTPSPPPPAITAAPSPDCPPTRPSITPRSAWLYGVAASSSSSRSWPWPEAWPPRSAYPWVPAPCRPIPRCSWRC